MRSESLITQLLSCADPVARVRLLNAFEQQLQVLIAAPDFSDAMAHVVCAMVDGHAKVREAAKSVCTKLLAQATVDPNLPMPDPRVIEPLLSDRDPLVRGRALKALQILNAKHLGPTAINLLNDADPTVQEAAAKALSCLDAQNAAEPLQHLLTSARVNTVIAALRALTRLRAIQAIPTIERCMRTHQHDAVVEAARSALLALNAVSITGPKMSDSPR